MLTGQVSFEFFLLFSLVLFVVFGLLFVSNELSFLTGINGGQEFSKAVAFRVAHATNNIFLSSNGTNTTVIIPANYSVEFSAPRQILVRDPNNRSGASNLLTSNVTISISENASEIFIQNINDTIYITSD